jgi:hypothetical protein
MAKLTNIPDATDEDLLPLADDEDLKPLAVEDATDEDLLPLAPAEQPAQGSIVGDIARGVGGQVKEMVTRPLQTIGGMIKGAVEGIAAPLTVPIQAIQTIMGASPSNVLRNLPALDTQALRDAGWDEPRIEHMLDQRNKVANSLMEDMDAGEKKVREDTANGVGFYLSLLAGGIAGKGGAALAERLGAKGLAAKALSHIPAGSAGLGTFSGTAAAVRGEAPREVAVQAGTGAVLGGLMGGVPLAGDIPIVKRQLARAGEAMGHGVSPEGTPLTPEQAARAAELSERRGRPAIPDEIAAAQITEGSTSNPLLAGPMRAMELAGRPSEGAVLRDLVENPPTRGPGEGLAKPAGPPLSAAEARTAHPVVQKLTKVLKEAKPLLKNQKEINKEQRSARLGASKAARDAAGGGEAGAKAARAALKSPFPKAEFTGVRESFQQAEIETLHKMIVDTPLSGYETIRAEGALAKILGINAEGKGLVAGVPNASELALLREVFGKDFVQAALDKRTLMGKIGHEVASVLNVPRAVMTSFDMSAPGRQGFLLSTTPQFWQNLAPMAKAWGSNKFYDAGMKEMQARPEWEAYKRSDGAFTDVNGMLGPMEEAFATRLTNKLPVVARSARAHTFFLNRLRLDTFRRLVEDAKKSGIADPLKDKAFMESATHYVNTATGRGRLPGKLQRSAEALNTVFFSPRLLMSRAETFNPKYYASLSPVVRAAAIRNNLSAAVAATTAASLAAMIPSVTVGLNPLEADFMKVKEGNTRFDLYAGHLQLIRAAAQLTDIGVSGLRGEEPHSGNPKYPPTAWSITERFFENKTSPVASFVLTVAKGVGRDGKPVQWDKEVAARLIPLMVQDTYTAIVEMGITPTSAAAAAAAFTGVGTQTYGSPVTRQKGPLNIVKEGIETFGLPTIEYKTANGKNARGIVPREHAEQYTKEVQEAEGKALAMLVSNPGFIVATPEKQETILKKVVSAYRTQVKMKWVNANKAAFSKGASSNASIRLVPPPAGPGAPLVIPPEDTP